MSVIIRLHPDAEAELDEARNWYNSSRAGLGVEFVRCVEESIERIRRDPESYAEVFRGARQLMTRRFPYSVIYRVEKIETVVYSVFHHSRDPEFWKSRL